MESPVSGREKGKHNKGRALHRAVDDNAPSPQEERTRQRAASGRSLFAKPDLDNMGPGTDMPTPAGAVSRSLFKKQTTRETHGSDFGIPEGAKSLFRKNSLDEMTVRRTEKPVEGMKPAKPEDVKPVVRQRIGAGSYEDPAEASRQKRRPGKTGRPGK
jgi:excinuclease ABC subunit B